MLFLLACQEYNFATKAVVGSGGVDTAVSADEEISEPPPPEVPTEDTGDDGMVEVPP